MAETKDSLAAERDALRAENESLKQQLATIHGPVPYAPAQQFFLSEGDRQELEAHGVATIGGVRMTAAEVRAKLAGGRQSGVVIKDPPAPPPGTPPEPQRTAVRGVDYIYPSVYPGAIDPAVAGTPGISGPAAGTDAAPPPPPPPAADPADKQ